MWKTPWSDDMIHDELVRNKIQTSYKNVPMIMFFNFIFLNFFVQSIFE